MPRILWKWLALTFSLCLIPYLVSGVHVESIGAAIAGAAVLGLLNTFLRPIFVLLTLPFTLVTLGLFLFVVNALLFQAAAYFVSGFHIDGFGSALLASLVVSVVNWLLDWSSPQRSVGWFRQNRTNGASTTRPVSGGTIDLKERPDGHWE